MQDPAEAHLAAAEFEFDTLKLMEATADGHKTAAAEAQELLEQCLVRHLTALAEIAGVKLEEFIESGPAVQTKHTN